MGKSASDYNMNGEVVIALRRYGMFSDPEDVVIGDSCVISGYVDKIEMDGILGVVEEDFRVVDMDTGDELGVFSSDSGCIGVTSVGEDELSEMSADSDRPFVLLRRFVGLVEIVWDFDLGRGYVRGSGTSDGKDVSFRSCLIEDIEG